ncbi:MAG: hypothetical protein Ct9H90mP11_05220 [Acidimicrobiales bacterium]|nr:MAG: hypothetical protein Ct9H90mP11_05220 [Acidimicrobiales bacterium]
MFDTLTDRLGNIFGRLRSRGKLSESDIKTVMAEVRTALLEADVNLKVARHSKIRSLSVVYRVKYIQLSILPSK